MIRKLREFQIGQVIRQDGPATHRTKAGTPTMGGLLILTVGARADAAVGGPDQSVHLDCGARDRGVRRDRVRRRLPEDRPALASRPAAPLQDGLADRRRRAAVGVALLLLANHEPSLYSTRLIFPFFKRLIPDLGWFYVPFAVVVLVGATNEVNLTDGLDGLAISVFAVSAAAFTALAYVIDARRVLRTTCSSSGLTPKPAELTIFCGALVGASLGFLWWNCYPAEIFMGDVGSLASAARSARSPPHQAGDPVRRRRRRVRHRSGVGRSSRSRSFKLTGRRVFKMAPIHHHFELIGWSEPKVITRFVIVAIIFALFSLTTLKLR